jgi:hypothetical protein
MAGGEQVAGNFTGWRAYINTMTTAGRRNIVIATYGTIFFTVWFYKRSKRRSALKAPPA